MFKGLMATISISDESSATDWYARLFDRQPDARPMAGLAEWRLAENFGMQIWADADRAGGSTVVIDVDDLDAAVARLDEAGIDHGEPSPGGGQRILPIADPDGNQVVFSGE
jgi:catechol 2,3-dioxygenase-like lactoylglutathione lyase family enzyme